MKLLLDTRALLWWLDDNKALSAKARRAIRDARNTVFVSAATAWEMSIKQALGKLQAPDDLADALTANRFHPLPITINHATAAGSLPRHHDDPFDRMLVAQAHAELLTLVTQDPQIGLYGVPILWR
jgi:PIN domain nuclease of toxin-antitoxin system